MNRTRSTLIGTAVAIALFGPGRQAGAQEPLEEVVVSGIRMSNRLSLETKRDADTVTEVITAEDIGKMPDKNVADSLSRVVGVTTSSASANEGGFDENDRISMRGTNPSLTQTLLNGHSIAAGDWFVLNQVTQVGRSVSYTLLPSELVDKIVVHKTSQASLVEGGVAGSVDIITRRPLNFDEQWTFSGSAGVVYAEQPDETDPQFSALFNWKNEADNFGVLLQGFSEERHLRRDGVELLGYDTIAAGSPVAISNPDLAGVEYPRMIGAALFEQERKRTGGMIDVEFRPNDAWRVEAQYFMSNLEATNYNRNYLVWATHFINSGAGQAPDPGYVVRNNTLVEASFTGVPGTFYGVYDQISRPEAEAEANYGTLSADWTLSDELSFNGQVGTSEGHGKTPRQDVSETLPGAGNGANWQLQGIGSAPNFAFGPTNNSTPFPNDTPVDFGWIFGAQNIDVEDDETWAQIDGNYAVDRGVWSDLQFGVRYNEHQRESVDAIAQGPTGDGTSTSNYPTTWHNYPSDFNTFGGSFPTDVWYWTPSQLAAYNGPGLVQRDPIERMYYQYWFNVEEDTIAGYLQANFRGSNWSGNIGLRYADTDQHVLTYTQTTGNDPDAILGSLFGPFKGIPVDTSYDDWLPSANLRWSIRDDLIARFAIAKTMSRPDYSALAGFTDLTPPAAVGQLGSGTGGNPSLEPIRSTNYDAQLEWYFAENSLLSAGLFYMDLDNYVGYGSEVKSYLTFSTLFPDGAFVDYLLTVPVNTQGRVQGIELAYQQAITENIGFAANYTYADGEQTEGVIGGDDRLVGTSKNTYNLSAYYETQRFNARVTYTYRSEFFSGLDRNTAFSQDETDALAASLGYIINDNFSVTLDGQNLNDPTLKYYARNETQPRAFYKNGPQYYLSFRFKF